MREADVVTCATTASTPLFPGDCLRPGAHVDAVGAFQPQDRELDAVAVKRARVVVESYAGVLPTAGDLGRPGGRPPRVQSSGGREDRNGDRA